MDLVRAINDNAVPVLVLALLGTQVVIVLILLKPQLLAARIKSDSSSDEDKSSESSDDKDDKDNDKKDEEDKEKDKEKPYVEKHESLDILGSWVEAQQPDGDEDQTKLFTASHRKYPKTQEYIAKLDYTLITFTKVISKPVVTILQEEIKEDEDLYDEAPNVEAETIYLHKNNLDSILEKKKLALETLEKEANESEEKTDKADDKDKETDGKAEKTEAKATEKESTEKSADGSTSGKEEEGEKDEDDKTSTKSADSEDEKKKSKEKLEYLKLEVTQLDTLLKYISKLMAPTAQKLGKCMEQKKISFNLLSLLFPYDSEVVTVDSISNTKVAYRITETYRSVCQTTIAFTIVGYSYMWSGTAYEKTTVENMIFSFKGLRLISELNVRPMTPQDREELMIRGQTYRELSCPTFKFLDYRNVLIQVTGHGRDQRVHKMRAEGRAIVDARSFRRINPDSSRFDSICGGYYGEAEVLVSAGPEDADPESADEEESTKKLVKPGDTIEDQDLILLPSTVFGFSLVKRDWGEMLVEHFTEVTFRPDAFDQLVLEEDKKELLKGLVEQNSVAAKARSLAEAMGEHIETEKTDFIDGKGGGLVFALHGRPGVGKTLTAEAVAEMLQVPLYSIGAGELGGYPAQLETSLRDVLDIANNWGAVALIDEADVFLEARSLNDLNRNSMVTCFLRLLEYHSGILFLTTNRVRSIDTAFLSRFSIGLAYPDLDAAKRTEIWKKFLERAGAKIEKTKKDNEAVITTRYLEQLCEKSFNGRNIKNMVRTAKALALSRKEELGEEHINNVVKITETFMEDVNAPDESGVYDAAGEGWKDKTNVYM